MNNNFDVTIRSPEKDIYIIDWKTYIINIRPTLKLIDMGNMQYNTEK